MENKLNQNLKFKIYNLKLQRRALSGLTMIEMMVALSVFTLVLVIVLAIFVQGARIQRRTAQIQEQLADARFVVDTMARELRLGTLKYDGISNNINDSLSYISAEGNVGFFKKSLVIDECGDNTPPCILWSPNIVDNNAGTPISTKNITIDDLYFLVTPSDNPFLKQPDGSFLAHVQPTVTIHFKGKYIFATEEYPLEFQTTVTTRQYLR